MSGAVWAIEWTQAARRRRVMVLSALVPLALVSAVALGGAPPPHAALVYTVLFAFFGTFGAAIPWARDAERGLLHRLVLAGAIIDLIELLPSLVVIVAVYQTGPGAALRLFLMTLAGLVFANLLGVIVAALARSLAETALLAAVAALLLLHLGGAFRTPAAGSGGALIEPAIPFYYMHQAIRTAVLPAP